MFEAFSEGVFCCLNGPLQRRGADQVQVGGFREVLGEVLASGDAFFGQSWVGEVLVFVGGFELVVALAVADEEDVRGHVVGGRLLFR